MLRTWTEGFDALLVQLTPHGGPGGEICFPSGVTVPEMKIAEAEPPHAWFRRCVDGPLAGQIERCAVEPNLAVFATVRWAQGGSLDYANVQVLKTQVALDEYYYDDRPDEGFLLRLDWDYGTLGPMFTHPLPHVHYSSFDAAPRFGVDGLLSDNILIDFFEFVYRHLLHDDWVAWAKRVWHRERGAALGDADPFDAIVSAFRESNIAILRQHEHHVRMLKQCLRREKDRWSELRASTADLELLRYPG